MALPATEDFAVANDPLTTSSDWSQPGATLYGCRALAGELDVSTAGGTATDDESAYWVTDTFADAQYSQLTLTAISTASNQRIGVILRASAGKEAFMVRYRTNTTEADFQCYYWDNDEPVNRVLIGSSYSQTMTPGDKMRVEIDDSDLISLYVDTGGGYPETADTTWDGSTAVGSFPNLGSGSPGVYNAGPNTSSLTNGDDWEGGDLFTVTVNTRTLKSQIQATDGSPIG